MHFFFHLNPYEHIVPDHPSTQILVNIVKILNLLEIIGPSLSN